jgi:N4-(beta-N-acetylglucosaminyl)-L-asparaginase
MAEINRRDFVRTSLVGSLAVGAVTEPVFGQAPAVMRGTVRPVVISSNNGNRFKNGGTATCVQHAF